MRWNGRSTNVYIGEKVGTKNGQSLDIALDPLEGTNFVAKIYQILFRWLRLRKR